MSIKQYLPSKLSAAGQQKGENNGVYNVVSFRELEALAACQTPQLKA
jgi:hypothetical protein